MVKEYSVDKKLKKKSPRERNPNYKGKKDYFSLFLMAASILITAFSGRYVYQYAAQEPDSNQGSIILTTGFLLFLVFLAAIVSITIVYYTFILIGKLIKRIRHGKTPQVARYESQQDWNRRDKVSLYITETELLASYTMTYRTTLSQERMKRFKTDLWDLIIDFQDIRKLVYTPDDETFHIFCTYTEKNYVRKAFSTDYDRKNPDIVNKKTNWYDIELFFTENQDLMRTLSERTGIPLETVEGQDYLLPQRV